MWDKLKTGKALTVFLYYEHTYTNYSINTHDTYGIL